MRTMGRHIALDAAGDIQRGLKAIGISADAYPVVGMVNNDLARAYPVHDDTPRKITITITSLTDAAKLAAALDLVAERHDET